VTGAELGQQISAGLVEAAPDARGTLEAGVMLVEKPFTEAALLDRVRRVLDAG